MNFPDQLTHIPHNLDLQHAKASDYRRFVSSFLLTLADASLFRVEERLCVDHDNWE